MELFFVLSGFVLTLPVLGMTRRYSWTAYYPSRMSRLYIPVPGVLALASVLLLLIPRANVEIGIQLSTDGTVSSSMKYLKFTYGGTTYQFGTAN